MPSNSPLTRNNAAPSQDLPVIHLLLQTKLRLTKRHQQRPTAEPHKRFQTALERWRESVFADAYDHDAVWSGGQVDISAQTGGAPSRGATGRRPVRDGGTIRAVDAATRQTGLGEFGASGGDSSEKRYRRGIHGRHDRTERARSELHHRMAVIQVPERSNEASRRADDAAALLDPYDGSMQTYPVSSAVNSRANDSPELIEPVGCTRYSLGVFWRLSVASSRACRRRPGLRRRRADGSGPL